MTEMLEKAQVESDLAARLARVRADLDAKQTAREQREAEVAMLREVEEAELKLRNTEAVEEAEQSHGEVGKRIALTYTPLGVVIVKRPPSPLYKKFVDGKKGDTTEAMQLVRPCVVYPHKALFDQWIEEFPGVLPMLAKQCCQLAGFSFEEAAGK